ncbi:type II secretion system secretin GspD [Methylococcus sp. EFPC2]|uniref:type II secretion system secretin GspD n=1 Tax=Methylococcus sp. EFPC2 TaxID=2812648 RepID=UPI0019684BAA|nr:type II secretion system secretin GspD [Methylococcus sp. EFPC2]QSA96702.1 type II secretion system secretin GspD [Methylococcus sp. EFPC2]
MNHPNLKRRVPANPKRLAAGIALLAMSLNGCEYLGPVAQKQPVPKVLLPQEPPAESEAAPPAAESKPRQEKEYYPPSGGLVGQGSPSVPAAQPAKEGKYTLNFDEADLGEVSKVILGDTLKLNYVLNPKVVGKVSLQTTRPLAEDELIPTLEMLLRMNGAVLIKDGPLYKIEPEAAGTVGAAGARLGLGGRDLPAGYQLRVVPLRYVGVQEMQKVVEPLMPPKSIIRADEVRNLLLLAGTSDELESVIDTIRLFDVDFMRGMAVALFPLRNVDAVTIAEELTKLLGESAGKGPLGGMFRLLPIERLNAIMAVSPQPRYLDEVENWIERLDRYNTDKSGSMHVYRVQNVDAAELANTLGQIFGQGGGRGRGGASLAPGLSGASIGGGGASGGFGGADDSGFGDGASSSSSSSSFGGTGSTSSTTTGTGGRSSLSGSGTGGLGGSSASGSGSGGLGAGGLGSGGSSGSFSRRTTARGATATELGNNMRIVADPSNNALIIMAKAQDYKEIETVIKELDVLPLQVLIDATIVEVSLTGSLQYGLQWLFTHGQSAEALAGSKNLLENAANAALAASGPGGFAYAFAGKDIKVIVNALAEDKKINVVSSPSLMVLNNQEAQINVGDRVPTTTSSSTNLNSGATNPFSTATIQYQESGVTLKVRPRVNSGGLVIMDIYQEISTPSEVVVGGTNTFQFAQRKVQSQVAVGNGETLALGGLISNTVDSSQSGIPWLSNVPVLGYLFGSRSKTDDRKELVVLITPRVVEKRRDIAEVTNEFRRRLTGIYQEHRLAPPPPARP